MNYNNQHTFDNYIVSECNKEAYTACRSIVDDADGRFVALYGPSPCGKTHLLHIIKTTGVTEVVPQPKRNCR